MAIPKRAYAVLENILTGVYDPTFLLISAN